MTRTADFDYELPDDAIAQEAIEPRDHSRLLDARTLTDHRFSELPRLVEPGDVVVVNSTRVRAARLIGTKSGSGGRVELLLLDHDGAGVWTALCKPARRIKEGHHLQFGGIVGRVVRDPVDGIVGVALSAVGGSVEDRLSETGTVPLPPYFRGRLDDDDRYQTMFAKRVGSAAAPTAGLHFTPRVAAALADRGVELVDVDLEVGLDTFRPITTRHVEDHDIHRERFFVPDATTDAIAAARARGSRIVAIGTTVVRTLESAAIGGGEVAAGSGTSSLFITPGHEFRVVDRLVTNFHAPATSLVVLIAAILGDRWREVYATALARGYRFLSFGDAMFIDEVRSR